MPARPLAGDGGANPLDSTDADADAEFVLHIGYIARRAVAGDFFPWPIDEDLDAEFVIAPGVTSLTPANFWLQPDRHARIRGKAQAAETGASPTPLRHWPRFPARGGESASPKPYNAAPPSRRPCLAPRRHHATQAQCPGRLFTGRGQPTEAPLRPCAVVRGTAARGTRSSR